MPHLRLTSAPFLLLVSLLATGCTLRYAHSDYGDPILDDARSGIGLEGGARGWSGDLPFGRWDVQILGAYQRFEFHTDAVLARIDARGRYFPVATGQVQPFVGFGFGGLRLFPVEEDDLNCRNRQICIEPGLFDHRRQEQLLNFHATLGTEVPIGQGPFSVVLAGTREFGADGLDWDLNEWRLAIGLYVVPDLGR